MNDINPDFTPRATSCEWVVDEDHTGVSFCGSTKLHGTTSYCTEHNALAYEPSDSDYAILAEILELIT